MFGKHHVLNALSVVAICHYEGIPAKDIQHLRSFQGVKRRFTAKKIGQQVLIDDYAHHPIEITATIDSARREYPNKKIVAIFQPHTFTSANRFVLEFVDSVSLADSVYLCDIFSSERENDSTLTLNDLAERIDDASILD